MEWISIRTSNKKSQTNAWGNYSSWANFHFWSRFPLWSLMYMVGLAGVQVGWNIFCPNKSEQPKTHGVNPVTTRYVLPATSSLQVLPLNIGQEICLKFVWSFCSARFREGSLWRFGRNNSKQTNLAGFFSCYGNFATNLIWGFGVANEPEISSFWSCPWKSWRCWEKRFKHMPSLEVPCPKHTKKKNMCCK